MDAEPVPNQDELSRSGLETSSDVDEGGQPRLSSKQRKLAQALAKSVLSKNWLKVEQQIEALSDCSEAALVLNVPIGREVRPLAVEFCRLGAPLRIMRRALELGLDPQPELRTPSVSSKRTTQLPPEWSPAHWAARYRRHRHLDLLAEFGATHRATIDGETLFTVFTRSFASGPLSGVDGAVHFLSSADGKCHISDWELDCFAKALASPILRALLSGSRAAEHSIDRLLEAFESLERVLGRGAIQELVSQARVSSSNYTLLQAFCMYGAPLRQINALRQYTGPEETVDSGLQYATCAARPELWRVFIDEGASLERRYAQGMTPLLAGLQDIQASQGSEQTAVELLHDCLAAGVDIQLSSSDGVSVGSIACQQRNFRLLHASFEHGFSPAALNPAARNEFVTQFARLLYPEPSTARMSRDSKLIGKALRVLCKYAELIGTGLIRELDNHGAGHDESLLKRALATDAGIETIEVLLDSGASCDVDTNLIEQMAASYAKYGKQLIELFAENGLPADKLVHDGSGLLQHWLERIAHLTPWETYARGYGVRPSQAAYADQQLEWLREQTLLLVDCGANLFSGTEDAVSVSLPLEKGARSQTPTELLCEIVELSSKLPAPQQSILWKLLSENCQDVEGIVSVHTIACATDSIQTHATLHGNLGLNAMLSELLYRTNPKALGVFVNNVIRPQIVQGGSYENAAELMLLLNHPGINSDDGTRAAQAIMEALSHAYTAELGTQREPLVRGRTTRNFARIGQLTFCHPLWMYDAERPNGDPSLLEKFGFTWAGRRVTDWSAYPGTSGSGWGAGFYLSPGRSKHVYDCMQLERGAEAEQKLVLKSVRRQISSETYPEFRRGYLLVSHPAHGTLIIRNSSHDFGRDRLLEVAYWSRKAIGRDWSKRDLLELDQEFLDTNFKSVFSNKLGSRRVEVDRSIEFLLDETEGIIQAYDTWKFATGIDTAWQELGSDAVLTGAHISNGFPYVVERLKCCVEKPWSAERPLPDLAFFHRHTAPLIPIEYELDGESHSIFQLDRKRLELLAKLADQNVSPEELEGSGVREFIQAGLSSQGVLVMLRPNRERADLDLRWPRVIGS